MIAGSPSLLRTTTNELISQHTRSLYLLTSRLHAAHISINERGYCASSVAMQKSSPNKKIKTVSLPPFMRMRDFARTIGLNPQKILARPELGVIKKTKREIILEDTYTGQTFAFDDANTVSLPFHVMERIVISVTSKANKDVRVVKENSTRSLRSPPFLEEGVDRSSLTLVERRPLVALLGHIDHGKTTLVDTLRNAKTAEYEEGLITQKVGVWPVLIPVPNDYETNDGIDEDDENDNDVVRDKSAGVERKTEHLQCTFLDTPGHVHFYQMREDSARVANAAILVVASDEPELMGQTIESINCLMDMDVPVVVAINKIDLKNSDPARTRSLLEKNGLLQPGFCLGGVEPEVVEISAKTRQNLSRLERAVYRAIESRRPLLAWGDDIPAEGVVIESSSSRQTGALLRVVVTAGILRVGQSYTSGLVTGVVRSLTDEFGKGKMKEARPGQVVYVSGAKKGVGLSDVPPLGEPFFVTKDRKEAEKIADYNRMVLELQRRQISGPLLENKKHNSFTVQDSDDGGDDTMTTMEIEEDEEETLSLPVIIKAESAGKLNALIAALVETEGVRPVRATVGTPDVGDIELAKSNDDFKVPIVCFGITMGENIKRQAHESGVPVMEGMVMHELVEELRQIVANMPAK
mmetsp:Transcript_2353/g.3672  ORF Transcript_2353/g.3672 Transcript_2353/m.3672 type:complete len:637 (-) Transcript_2353:557-2467(-)